MTTLYLTRKLAGLCPRCGRLAGVTLLCPRCHRRENRRIRDYFRVRRSLALSNMSSPSGQAQSGSVIVTP